jgi:1,4-dihydroxy-2-naphthoyl-CoA synthase
VRDDAVAFAAAIAASAPMAVESIRATMRGDLADRVAAATVREAAEQARLRVTADFAEGTRATAERRPPRFTRS